MKKVCKIFLLISIILSLMSFYNFDNYLKTDQHILRPAVKLTPEDIFPNKKFGKVTCTEYYHDFPDNLLVWHEYVLYWSNNDVIRIDEIVFKDKKSAYMYLIEDHLYNYTHPDIESLKDEPAVVGDVSYFNGKEFIRDNIIIKINVSEKYTSRISYIAKQIDNKISQSPTLPYSKQLRPVINNFGIAQNQVKYLSETKLLIDTEDPNNISFNYKWKFNGSSTATSYGKIKKNDSGHYYYIADLYSPKVKKIELTLIVINEYGFFSDSTIKIKIITE